MKNIIFKIYPYKTIITFFLFIIFFCNSFYVKAQDKINKTDNTIIEAKVIEISSSEIKYKKFSNLNGPTYTISKGEVQMIIYENGEKETFNGGNIKVENKQPLKPVIIIKKDSIQCIEELFGVKLENTPEKEGGVKIIKLENQSIFTKVSTNRAQKRLNKLTIYKVNNGKSVRVRNTSELARVLFDSYNRGISKIELTSGKGRRLTFFTIDPSAIDISGLSKCHNGDSAIKKLNSADSKMAGRIVEGIYTRSHNWSNEGAIAGLALGVAGIGLVSLAALIPPDSDKIPIPPPNVDATAWKNGYIAQFRKKRILTGVIGSVVGTAAAVIIYSSK